MKKLGQFHGATSLVAIVTAIIILSAGEAYASMVNFAPLPAVPTRAQCQQIYQNDNEVVSAYLKSSQADENARFGDRYTGERLRFQEANTQQWLALGKEAGARYSQCLALAQTLEDANRSASTSVGASNASGVYYQSFSSRASEAIRAGQRASEITNTVDYMRSLVASALVGQTSDGSLSGWTLYQAQRPKGLSLGTLPPLSSVLTSISLRLIREINNDALYQLDDAMGQFTSAMLPSLISDTGQRIVETYVASLPQPLSPAPTVDPTTVQAITSLDQLVVQMAELTRSVNAQIVSDRSAEREKMARAEASRQAELARRQQQASQTVQRPPATQYQPAPQYTSSPRQKSEEDLRLERHLACTNDIIRRMQAGDVEAGFEGIKCDEIR